ncbi:MAG: hypothetical protein K2X36_09145 [Microbacteriaceae bacterium]|nr:hypothetical protein [Microbacteriaceae bacterium]
MSIPPKTIALIVGGVVVVGGAFAAAPALGDLFAAPLASTVPTSAEPVEYPVNESGETYGSPIGGSVPKLIPARSDEGEFGYVRVTELDQQRNLAKSTTNPDATFAVDVYEVDGSTVIGSLTVTADTPGARDGLNN